MILLSILTKLDGKNMSLLIYLNEKATEIDNLLKKTFKDANFN